MQLAMDSSTGGMQRVKVYRLNTEGMWDDKGTGSVSVEYMEQSDSVGLVVISEEDTRTLLIHRISREDIYQRQGEDTIITWTDTELGTDIALSFQEAAGCNYVWEQIQEVQTRSEERRGGDGSPSSSGASEGNLGSRSRQPVDEFDQLGTSLEGDFPDGGATGPIDLPPPDMANLQDIARALREVSPFQRDRVAEQMLRGSYLRRLLDLFRDVEDLEDDAGLAAMHTAVRGAIMLNDTGLLEALLSEENVMDSIGALEYDPELPERQRHRDFLRERVVFREVVPISDAAVRAKIHQTYRMGYLKDVILPRVLDDATFATLSSLMLFNNVEVLMSLTKDPRFFPELFRRLGAGPGGNLSKPDASWVDLVSFLQELCGLAKHLQAGARTNLLNRLADLGLFKIMAAAMERGDDALRLRACDVLLAAGQHDPQPLRLFIEGAVPGGPPGAKPAEDNRRLLGTLIATLGTPNENGLQEQALELLRLLLDPDMMDGPIEKNSFLDLFYDHFMSHVMALLEDSGAKEEEEGGKPAATLVLVLELLCFCVGRHAYRIKYYILRNHVVEATTKPLLRREPWVGVAVVRFLRTCVGLKDDFYNRYLVRHNLFEPVIQAFLANGPRYNLLNSVVLEMVEFIRAENIKALVSHLVEKFGAELAEVDYVDTFQALRLKYDQSQQRNGPGSDVTSTAAARQALEQQRRRPEARALSRDEEDYFAEGDDEEEGPPGPAPSPANSGTSGRPPSPPFSRPPGPGLGGGLFGPLVDYDDDDDAPESPPRSSTSSVDAGSVSSSGSKRGPLPLDAADGLPESPRSGKRPRPVLTVSSREGLGGGSGGGMQSGSPRPGHQQPTLQQSQQQRWRDLGTRKQEDGSRMQEGEHMPTSPRPPVLPIKFVIPRGD